MYKRQGDGLIRFFREFLSENPTAQKMYQGIDLPVITEKMVDECLAEIPIEVNQEFIKEFILNGQQIVQKLILSEDLAENMDEDQTMNMML